MKDYENELPKLNEEDDKIKNVKANAINTRNNKKFVCRRS